ncbi:glucose dehydrogenase [Rhodococcus sp. Leaf7]|uniref:PQQ-dependent sugar dehydrogenase n=1 Tax=unclassified Rhodococcus (in: high G+C Gram-positive bacteria) TaxID=192944 RepID=UPI0006F4FF37|nr:MULTISPECIES: PQQ-dependent sugar dehydrogenase [unclassified Rhodococcus (in: high G+C Gram-positive bacteria)]KQU04295.1 glucose dehydrogenase [Rhodococcus sp. Leaf7]KQU40480.1 glucose dehydrogenase [Rhodococcus sp. Leaf247]
MTRLVLAGLALSAALTATACSSAEGADASPAAGTPSATTSSSQAPAPEAGDSDAVPTVDVTTVASGLDHPWDVVRAPDGTVLFDERAGRFTAIRPGGEPTPVSADLGDLFVGSETGLMGLALSPDFTQDRTLYSCQGIDGDSPTIGVVAWTVSDDWSSLTRTRTVISGFPVTSGRHGGCRVLAQPDGTLFVGTGDSAQGTVPQDPTSLGGKVLHIDAVTGAPAPGNPDPASPVFTLGHRNVQGLAARPGSDQIFSVEQGTSRDDEVNLLVAGGNYGYRPDRSAGYDESVAMTDPERVPGALDAVWSSGPSTIATASASFLDGDAWGAWNGMLAVGVQKGQEVLLLDISDDGSTVISQTTIPALSEQGRIRTVSAQPDGTLLVTTDNGDTDQVLLVTPR